MGGLIAESICNHIFTFEASLQETDHLQKLLEQGLVWLDPLHLKLMPEIFL